MENWDLEINGEKKHTSFSFSKLWVYKDLLLNFVRRDIVTLYKQTVLGPIWFVIQPLMTTLIYVFVFGNIANISTDGLPKPLFYLCGIVVWNYFMECFIQTSDTFVVNKDVFGKVYFPRIVVPLSKVTSGLLKFAIQFCLFLLLLIYFSFVEYTFNFGWLLLLVPLYILEMALFGLGFGLIFSSLTVKYRDLKFLVQFGVQLLMYVSPIIYPVSELNATHKKIIFFNPFSHIIEGFKFAFLGNGTTSLGGELYACATSIIVLAIGLYCFIKTEKKFIDTV